MRERKTAGLEFIISNSPILYSRHNSRREWCHIPVKYKTITAPSELQKTLLLNDQFKLGYPLPEKPQIYIVEYEGGNELNIYEAEYYDSSIEKSHPLLVTTLLFDESYKNIPTEELYTFVRGDSIANPWPLFYSLAWPEDICYSLKCTSSGLADDEWAQIAYFESPECLHKKFSNVDCLKIIGGNPSLLRHKIFIDFLVNFLEDAKNKHKEERGAVKKLLSDCLIPKNNKVDYSRKEALARELMLMLAGDIKRRCEKAPEVSIKGMNPARRGTGRTLTTPQYKNLKTWAKNNDARVAVLDQKKLSSLLFNPATKYINDLLKDSKDSI